MALTPEQIDTAYRKVWSTVPHAQRLSAFALEIATEVRKQDDALILQLVEALEYHRAQTRPIDRTDEALAAGRARLGRPHD